MVREGCKPNETTYFIIIQVIEVQGMKDEAVDLYNKLVATGAICKTKV